MAAKIKLQRRGAKNKPFYRVVIQDESAALPSRVIEIIGRYNPRLEPSLFEIDEQKAKDWLAKGAKPTEKVRILLGKAGILPPVDLTALKKKKPKAELKAEAEAKPEEEAKGPSTELGASKGEGEEKGEAKAEEKPEPLDDARGEEVKPEQKTEVPAEANKEAQQ